MAVASSGRCRVTAQRSCSRSIWRRSRTADGGFTSWSRLRNRLASPSSEHAQRKPRLRLVAASGGRRTRRWSPTRLAQLRRTARDRRLRRRPESHPTMVRIPPIPVRRSLSGWMTSCSGTSATRAWTRGSCRRSSCAIDPSPSGCADGALISRSWRTPSPGPAGTDIGRISGHKSRGACRSGRRRTGLHPVVLMVTARLVLIASRLGTRAVRELSSEELVSVVVLPPQLPSHRASTLQRAAPRTRVRSSSRSIDSRDCRPVSQPPSHLPLRIGAGPALLAPSLLV